MKAWGLSIQQAEHGEININKEHSLVIQNDATSNDIFLEVENTGETVEKLERFYLNEDLVENELNPDKIHYLNGSSILEPGDIVSLQIADVDANFFPIRNFNKIGVVTPSGMSSEALFTSSKENISVPDPIAIIGMNGRFPMAKDLNEFWENIAEGKDCVQEVPADRWDWREYYGDQTESTMKCNVKWGAFIKDIDKFDAGFFRISSREAELIDPQQRIFLETVWKTIEDAGYKA